jgi:hypothetical protein
LTDSQTTDTNAKNIAGHFIAPLLYVVFFA